MMLTRFIKWIFGCPPSRHLIMVWTEKQGEYGGIGQIETFTTVSIGRYKVLKWVSFYTPTSDLKKRG